MDKSEMTLFTFLLGIDLCISIIALILFVIFGQITVRKLRKNPATKDSLGMDLISGWDIIHVGMALAWPIKFGRRTKQSPFGMFHADPDVLYKHTTRFDRILAKIFFIPFTFAGAFAVVLMLLDLFGFFTH